MYNHLYSNTGPSSHFLGVGNIHRHCLKQRRHLIAAVPPSAPLALDVSVVGSGAYCARPEAANGASPAAPSFAGCRFSSRFGPLQVHEKYAMSEAEHDDCGPGEPPLDPAPKKKRSNAGVQHPADVREAVWTSWQRAMAQHPELADNQVMDDSLTALPRQARALLARPTAQRSRLMLCAHRLMCAPCRAGGAGRCPALWSGLCGCFGWRVRGLSGQPSRICLDGAAGWMAGGSDHRHALPAHRVPV